MSGLVLSFSQKATTDHEVEKLEGRKEKREGIARPHAFLTSCFFTPELWTAPSRVGGRKEKKRKEGGSKEKGGDKKKKTLKLKGGEGAS